MNGEDVFLHHTALQLHDDAHLATGDRITFLIQKQENLWKVISQEAWILL